jgi:ABC-type multidrug transport system fused ATPase/permease subunit
VDAVLVITLGAALILISPISGIVFISLFAIIWQILKNQLHKQSELLSKRETEISIDTSNLISNSLDSFKELFVLNRLGEIISQLSDQRKELAKVTAITSFNPQYAKYIFEFGIVTITFIVTAIQLWQYDASRAAGTITLFIAAGARMSPALLRMQQNFLMLSSSAGAAGPTLNLSERLRTSGSHKPLTNSLTTSEKFTPDVEISNLSFSYDDSNVVIRNLNLSVKSGDFLAIAGPSGAGKSTLIDLCLGILKPVSGSVSISDTAPIEAIRRRP